MSSSIRRSVVLDRLGLVDGGMVGEELGSELEEAGMAWKGWEVGLVCGSEGLVEKISELKWAESKLWPKAWPSSRLRGVAGFPINCTPKQWSRTNVR